MSFMLVGGPLQGWRHLHPVPLGAGHLHRADLCHLLHRGLRLAQAQQHHHSPAPEQVPTGVARSFEVLIPALVIILILHPLNLELLQHTTGMILPEAIMAMPQAARSAASDSLPAVNWRWGYRQILSGLPYPLAVLVPSNQELSRSLVI